ncbi:MAG TPA: hypothetical protein VET65_02025 [Candidatus Limnocylindrales bacterium]|nr:hypothetical protein [Candidatus Limnocylindrales bacterium]
MERRAPAGAAEPLNSDLPLQQAERGEVTARFIALARPAVLLGRHQDAGVVDDQETARLGWDVRRRLTPGGAVYMDRAAICVEVAVPASHAAASPDVMRATVWFGTLLAGALSAIGVAAVVADAASPPTAGLAAQACFGSWVRGEVLLDGRKVFGTAQYRRRGNALFQAVALSAGSHRQVVVSLAGSPQQRQEAAAAIDARSAVLTGIATSAMRDAIRAALESSSICVHD